MCQPAVAKALFGVKQAAFPTPRANPVPSPRVSAFPSPVSRRYPFPSYIYSLRGEWYYTLSHPACQARIKKAPPPFSGEGASIARMQAQLELLRGDRPVFSDREESGGSNLWPTDSRGPRASRWVQAAPAVNLRHVRRFEESGNSNLWFPDSCSIRRQQVGAGSACPLYPADEAG